VKTALIAAVALLLGATITGITSWQATEAAVSHELRQANERQEQRAAGAARLLISELLIAATYMEIMRGDRLYRRFDSRYRIEVPSDDMLLVFSYLTPDELEEITVALLNVQGLETFVNSQVSDGKRQLDARAITLVSNDIATSVGAAEVLKRAANAKDMEFPPFPSLQ
jgi:hypothetical protein